MNVNFLKRKIFRIFNRAGISSGLKKKDLASIYIKTDNLLSMIGEQNLFQTYSDIRILNNFINFKEKKVLDIGCGSGEFLIICNLIMDPLYSVGLDPSEGKGSNKNVIKIFKENIRKLDLISKIDIIKKDIWDFEITENFEFDIVSTNFSLHHIIPTSRNLLKNRDNRRHYKLFSKIFNLLEDDGTFIIKECSNSHLSKHWQLYGKIIGNENINWKTKHNPTEYMEILEKCGFKNISVTYKLSHRFPKLKVCLANRFARFFLDSTYFIIAKKS